MICTATQIENIIKNNPNKALLEIAQKQCKVLMSNIQGHKHDGDFKQSEYFENSDVYNVRKTGAVSNKDMFARIFQREEMVFTAQGGSAHFNGLDKSQEAIVIEMLSNVKYDLNLRQWVKTFALQGYRCDPMGVIFMEWKDKEVYPTYKCSDSIYDYAPNGRKLEYICFRLKPAEALAFGVKDEKLKEIKDQNIDTSYFRFVDDVGDYICQFENDTFTLNAPGTKFEKAPQGWKTTPAFLCSDIFNWDKPETVLSPIYLTLELADCFHTDRSIRDLQKKYSGFAKSIEPLLNCGTCEGTGQLSGNACPQCTPEGASRGTGYKLKTKVADVARFPLSSLSEGFDFNKIFGYVSPPIDVWNKQDTSLNDLENMISDVYWGTDNRAKTSGVDAGDKGIEETATKTLQNLQPVYARLNATADWGQNTENIIAEYIASFKYPGVFKKASITYGRYYILETPDELMEEYLNMRTKGASQLSLFDILRKYYHSLYKTNPVQLAIKLKLINVEPFVHFTIQQVQATNISKIDYLCKVYFSEWLAEKTDDFLFNKDEKALRADLVTYATAKAEAIKTDPLQEPVEGPILSKVA